MACGFHGQGRERGALVFEESAVKWGVDDKGRAYLNVLRKMQITRTGLTWLQINSLRKETL